MPAARPPRVFRVTGAAWLLGLSAAIAIVLLIEAAVRSGVGEALLLTPWLLLVIWVVYVDGHRLGCPRGCRRRTGAESAASNGGPVEPGEADRVCAGSSN